MNAWMHDWAGPLLRFYPFTLLHFIPYFMLFFYKHDGGKDGLKRIINRAIRKFFIKTNMLTTRNMCS